MNKVALHWQILIAIFLAIILGVFFPITANYVSWLGVLFLNALKMIVVPLVISSLITGITSVGDSKSLGKISGKTFLFYMLSSLMAIIVGLVLVNAVKPGVGLDISNLQAINFNEEQKSMMDTFLGIIPKNIFQSFAEGDMLPIIFFSLLFGFFINKVEHKSSDFLKQFFLSVFEVMMKITLFILRFAPLGVLGILTNTFAEQTDILALLLKLLKFTLLVIGGLFIHFTITLSIALYTVGKVNPLKHMKAMLTPILTAFSTSSSNGTLPVTIETVEKNAGVSNRIASFSLPLGATINMDGTALYELVAAGFVAQAYGIELSLGAQLVMVATALLASIGTAAIPMASLVTMAIIFEAVGLPLEGIALIVPVHNILDMFRTPTNVYSDTCCAVIVAKSESEDLKY